MGLRTKFNLVLLLVFTIGILVTGFVSHRLLRVHARDEVLQTAGAMMEAARAVRQYTVGQVRPHLEKLNASEFLPQTVPAYAATEVFNELRKQYPEYSYKEATLNPTNPRNRALDWESDIIQKFRDFPSRTEIVGERDTPSGRSLYMARPIAVNAEACITCHGVPSAAPKTLINQYGDANGFGWHLHEIVGTQVVSVPMEVAIHKADQAFLAFMGSLGGIFVVLFIVLNLMLGMIVIRPVMKISQIMEQVSTGKMDIPEFAPKGSDEISQLAKSFNRMRRSLEQAMKMLES